MGRPQRLRSGGVPISFRRRWLRPTAQMETDFSSWQETTASLLLLLLAEPTRTRCSLSITSNALFPQSEPFWIRVSRRRIHSRLIGELFRRRNRDGRTWRCSHRERGGRFRALSYLGFAQALARRTFPLDVVTDGGDGFVPVKLTEMAPQQYKLVIRRKPSTSIVQEHHLRDYVANGGIVLDVDPESSTDFSRQGNHPEERPDRSPSQNRHFRAGRATWLGLPDRPMPIPCGQQIRRNPSRGRRNSLEVSGADTTCRISQVHPKRNEFFACRELRLRADATRCALRRHYHKPQAGPNSTKQLAKRAFCRPDFQGDSGGGRRIRFDLAGNGRII